MLDKIGETFSGIISATTSFGIFVELSDIYVEGLVHVTALGNDYYHYEPTRHWLIGERTRRIFRLGDEVVVRVVQVNLDERKIDFELEEQKSARGGKPRKARRGSGLRRKSRK
jgi:ribonuclease R